MFAEERQEKLLGILREKRKVAVSEMCDVFNVSGATIRADLRQLEEEGLLTRTHGGAVLRTRASFEQASDDREIVNLSAKERIGQRAAALVEDGDIIVLDTGTTTLHSKLNNTSLAQFTAADRIDTVVVDRLPDDVQAYRNAGIQVISLDEENLL